METPSQKKWKFIGCEIIYREACRLISGAAARIDAEFLPKALHDRQSQEMVAEIQSRSTRSTRQRGMRPSCWAMPGATTAWWAWKRATSRW